MDLKLRDEIEPARFQRRASLLERINANMPGLEKAVEKYALNAYQQKAFELVLSGKAREAFDLSKEPDARNSPRIRSQRVQELKL